MLVYGTAWWLFLIMIQTNKVLYYYLVSYYVVKIFFCLLLIFRKSRGVNKGREIFYCWYFISLKKKGLCDFINKNIFTNITCRNLYQNTVLYTKHCVIENIQSIIKYNSHHIGKNQFAQTLLKNFAKPPLLSFE